jgi:hypothetical protein
LSIDALVVEEKDSLMASALASLLTFQIDSSVERLVIARGISFLVPSSIVLLQRATTPLMCRRVCMLRQLF